MGLGGGDKNMLNIQENSMPKRADSFVFDSELAPKALQVRRTKNYDQFRKIKGNRKVQMGHVNNLVKMISKYNLLPHFVGVVTKDGYIIDGQHRLEAAKANDLWFYFTIVPEKIDDIIVSLVNAVQLKWTVDNYINFFADRGEKQYRWIRELHEQYKVSNSSLIVFFTGGIGSGSLRNMREGKLQVFNNSEEEQYLLALLEGYMDLKHSFDKEVWVDQDFIKALRIIFQQFNSEQVKGAVARYGKIIIKQDHDKDYLRVFEDVFNKSKHDKNRIRFF